MKSIKIGVVGTGAFARCFAPLFQAHPLVRDVAFCERIPERLKQEMQLAGVTEGYLSFDDLLQSDCDAVAIFTQRDTHAPLAIRALRAGKHVYSAVPAGVTLDEIVELEKAVRETGLTYMMGETSYYYPSTIFCREMWRRGRFGRFVYGEGEYLHDMDHGFYQAYQHTGGPNWKQSAGVPPMLYPTHSTSMIISVTGARLTKVSCLGQVDQSGDGVFGPGLNKWDNPFSNETALFRTSDGGTARINEFRRVGWYSERCVRLSLFGTLGCYEEQPGGEVWTNKELEVYPLNDLIRCGPVAGEEQRQHEALRTTGTQADFFSGLARVHPSWRLPKSFERLSGGHSGSHPFLADDFVRSAVSGALPPNHIWAAARYNIPGLVAHQSALREGEPMDVPDLGDAPKGATLLEDILAREAPARPAWELPAVAERGEKYWLQQR